MITKADMLIANKICVAMANYINNRNSNTSCLNSNFNQLRGTSYGSYVYIYPKFTGKDFKVEEDKGWVYIRIVSDNLEVSKYDIALVYADGGGPNISHKLEETQYKVVDAEPIPGEYYDMLKFNTASRKVVIDPSQRGGTTLVVTSTKIPIPIDNISRVLHELLPSNGAMGWDNPIRSLLSSYFPHWTKINFGEK